LPFLRPGAPNAQKNAFRQAWIAAEVHAELAADQIALGR
jgi:hypothetical protein